MKAINLLGNKKVEVIEVPDPEPGLGQVRVKMRASGLCGSDLHQARGDFTNWRPEPLMIPGHEPCGEVEKLGEGVTHLKLGDRVTINHYMGCGHCPYCYSGEMWWCDDEVLKRPIGGNSRGALADYVVADAVNCLPLPDAFSFAEGALIACATGTSYSALHKLHPSGQETLIVIGLGPVGLAGVGLARAMGAKVIAIGRREDRLRLASQLGADVVIDVDAEDAVAGVLQHWPEGANLLLETAGTREAHEWIPKMLAKSGRASLVGFGNSEPSLNLGDIIWKQLTLHGSFVMPMKLYAPLLKLMQQNDLRLDQMVTHRFSIEQGVEAFELAYSKECGKIMFEWN